MHQTAKSHTEDGLKRKNKPEIFLSWNILLRLLGSCVMENTKKTGKNFQDIGKSIWGLESPSNKAIDYDYLQLLKKKKPTTKNFWLAKIIKTSVRD